MIHLRAPNMEPIFFSDSNYKYEWIQEDSASKAQDKLIKDIKNGYPVFLQTDLFFLHYYNSHINFPGHVIVCIGVDEKKKLFYVSDTNFQDIQEVQNLFQLVHISHKFHAFYLSTLSFLEASQSFYINSTC